MVKLFSLLFVSAVMLYGELNYKQISKAYHNSYELERQERYADAISALGPVIRAYPSGYTVNYRLGWLSYLNGSFSDAYRFYGRALAVAPSSLELLYSMVLLEVARQDWRNVETGAKKITAIDPLNQNGNYWLAVALRMQNQVGEARRVVERMLSHYPTSTSYLMEMARIQSAQGDDKIAVQMAWDVIILDPLNQEAAEFLNK